jgi:hypothetical protein
MRTYGFRATTTSNLHEAPTPGAWAAPSNGSYRRRLDDAMVAIFDRACAGNNLDAAADVLEVLLTWHRRRSAKYGRERRISDDHLKLMLADLKRLTILRKV